MEKYRHPAVVIGLMGEKNSGRTTFAREVLENEENHEYIDIGDVVIDIANEWRNSYPIDEIESRGINYRFSIGNKWVASLGDAVLKITHVPLNTESLSLVDEYAHDDNYALLSDYILAVNSDPSLLGSKINGENKRSHKLLLDWMGYFLKEYVDKNAWLDVIETRVWESKRLGKKLIIVDDLRSYLEEMALRRQGANIVKLARHDYELTVAKAEDKPDVRPEIVIHNDSTVEDLGRLAMHIYYRLYFNELETDTKAPEEFYASEPLAVRLESTAS